MSLARCEYSECMFFAFRTTEYLLNHLGRMSLYPRGVPRYPKGCLRIRTQRQISLDLSHSCRYRMRLISLVKSANCFEIMSLAHCEYNRYEAGCPSICEVCSGISGVCSGISRGVHVSVPYKYCKFFFVSLDLWGLVRAKRGIGRWGERELTAE